MLKSHYLKIIFFLSLSLNNLNSYANDEGDNATSPKIEAFTVHINQSIINVAGVQTQQLHSTQFSPEVETFASLVDLSPLIEIRKDYLAALAKQATAQITLKQSQRNLQRLENLQREKAVSTRKLLAQKSQLAIDKINFKATQQLAENIQLHAQSKWGEVLSHWFLTEQYPAPNMLNTLSNPLYLIYLPSSITPPIATIYVHPFGLREKAQSASLISSAPINYNQQAGTPFFYLSDEAVTAHQHRVTAWLPLKEDIISGFIIPASALVWHLSQAYVYLQINDELFKRIKISQKKRVSTKSYFIQQPLKEGDMLVSIGAQMLLSEEFRGQIPAEDDDDD